MDENLQQQAYRSLEGTVKPGSIIVPGIDRFSRPGRILGFCRMDVIPSVL